MVKTKANALTPPATPKKSKMSKPGGTKMQIDDQNDRSGTVGGVDTGTTGDISILSTPSCLGVVHFTTKKTFRFYCYSVPKLLVHETYGTGLGNNMWFTTGMMALPTDLLPLYMTRGEYENIPIDAKVVSTNTKVDFLYARTQFQANASDVSTAATSHQLYLEMANSAIERNHGRLVKYERSKDTVSVDPIVNENAWIKEVENKLYGPTTLTSTIRAPAICGADTEWDTFLAYNVKNQTNGIDSNTLELPNVDEFYTTTIAINNFNTNMINQTNYYINGRIKKQKKIWHPTLGPEKTTEGTNIIYKMYPFINKPQNKTTTSLPSNRNLTNVNSDNSYLATTNVYDYLDYIEKPNLRKWNPDHESRCPRHPMLYIGLREELAVNAGANPEYQSIQGFFQVTYTLHGEANLSTYSVRGSTVPYTAYEYNDSRPNLGQLGSRAFGRVFGDPVTNS